MSCQQCHKNKNELGQNRQGVSYNRNTFLKQTTGKPAIAFLVRKTLECNETSRFLDGALF